MPTGLNWGWHKEIRILFVRSANTQIKRYACVTNVNVTHLIQFHVLTQQTMLWLILTICPDALTPGMHLVFSPNTNIYFNERERKAQSIMWRIASKLCVLCSRTKIGEHCRDTFVIVLPRNSNQVQKVVYGKTWISNSRKEVKHQMDTAWGLIIYNYSVLALSFDTLTAKHSVIARKSSGICGKKTQQNLLSNMISI